MAEAAGVSPATVHYHLKDMSGVLLGVIERALEQMYDQRLTAIEAEPSIIGKLACAIEHGIPDTPSVELALMYESVALLRSTRELRLITKSYVERQLSLYRAVVDAGVHAAVFRPTAEVGVITRNLLALEDAYDLYTTLGVLPDGVAARANLRSYAETALCFTFDDR